VPRARLCTEYEWERGARGADGRDFPSGAHLPSAAANYDETHGKEGLGPDQVGAHPGSTSPFGLADMSGNAYEWATSSLSEGELVHRGGSYWHDAKTARAVNRTVSMSSLRDATLGVRICATPAAR
jgi:eukaryotic-like serine/threonine-protein kinase